MKSKYEVVVWDFNGTIADDVAVGVDSVNKMLSARGLSCLASHDEYRERVCFPIENYYQDLGFDFSIEPYEKIADEWFRLYSDAITTMKPVSGAPELIKYLNACGIMQIILSASESEIMIRQLEHFGISDYFDEIIGADNFYAVGKLGAARAAAEKYSGRHMLMIGDMLHDKEAADILGADCVLYTGGHGKKEVLVKSGGLTVDSMDEVKKIIFS